MASGLARSECWQAASLRFTAPVVCISREGVPIKPNELSQMSGGHLYVCGCGLNALSAAGKGCKRHTLLVSQWWWGFTHCSRSGPQCATGRGPEHIILMAPVLEEF